ncbi:MAG TPA: glycosyl hydrolase family 28 protein [Niabella sp.]|nr:glycosyl hydrolase family 28 protein [Niabella sp.]HOZ97884.1 glycosyl hydrolase family 28 protein [Niabella sp.]HQW13743.1 glycosyl hydrolase family 28 protein [Niabella sp.]HQX19138.1 glycosyl hydrolase family 28 protein [Niabella sp.]HQX42051.1 glycosyl hydrolase family 28 protein [Niabella sp.]
MIKKYLLIFVLLVQCSGVVLAQEIFPDGTPIPEWFRQIKETNIKNLGKQYRLTAFGVKPDSNIVQTKAIQAVIDKAAENGGGVIIVPKGTFLSGSLFFKPKTHLYLEPGATIKGSTDISDFALQETRIEGQTVKYFTALVNADKVDGFTISGKGTLNGNGLTYWKHFWLRRAFNPQCTNMDEMRPRLLYVSNSRDVQISGIRLINSPFWTSHYYKCENLKLLHLYIYAPYAPVKAPSSDAIDLDVCKNVLIKNCYMSVNDDAVALKGGKGPNADKDPNNGGNSNIIIEDNTFGFCHSALTCGSESIHNRNIILRTIKIEHATRLLWLKMRPDTPQNYEYISVEDIKGNVGNMLFIQPWTQFFDLKGEKDIRLSYASNISLKNIKLECDAAFNVKKSEQYFLKNFYLSNINVKASKSVLIPKEAFENLILEKVNIEHLNANKD